MFKLDYFLDTIWYKFKKRKVFYCFLASKWGFYVSVIQGTRVWVREKEQLLPATVNSCGDGTLVITSDYGEVRKSVHLKQEMKRVRAVDSSCTRAVSPGQWISISIKGRLIESLGYDGPFAFIHILLLRSLLIHMQNSSLTHILEAMVSFTRHACFIVCSGSRTLNLLNSGQMLTNCSYYISVCVCVFTSNFYPYKWSFCIYGQCEKNSSN